MMKSTMISRLGVSITGSRAGQRALQLQLQQRRTMALGTKDDQPVHPAFDFVFQKPGVKAVRDSNPLVPVRRRRRRRRDRDICCCRCDLLFLLRLHHPLTPFLSDLPRVPFSRHPPNAA